MRRLLAVISAAVAGAGSVVAQHFHTLGEQFWAFGELVPRDG